MDPTSLIGTAAAAAQLASLCKNLFCLLKTAKATLSTYVKSIEELLAVSNLIIRKPPLHTHEITDLVHSLIELLDSLQIPARASRNRLAAFWTLFWKGSELSDVFVTLETKKSTILLCIAGVQASLLQDIRDDIANMNSQGQHHTDPEESGATSSPAPRLDANVTAPGRLPPTANERRTRDAVSGKVLPQGDEGSDGSATGKGANVVVDYVEMNCSEVKARQVAGFANGRLAGEKERIFIGKAVMKGNGQMVIGFSN